MLFSYRELTSALTGGDMIIRVWVGLCGGGRAQAHMSKGRAGNGWRKLLGDMNGNEEGRGCLGSMEIRDWGEEGI